jgi:pimeloyl-ACP methyl ester carboxylesterase
VIGYVPFHSLGGQLFIISRGYRIRYQAFGAGPTIVLLHGHPMWGGRWLDRGYVERLQDRFRLLVPDLLGHGDSDKPSEAAAYGNPNIAADVLAILDAEGVGAAHVWGYSWGAIIAEHLAATAPSRVASLILGGFPLGLDADQRAAMEPPVGERPATIEEVFADWPPQVAELYIARNDFGAIQAVQETIYKFATTVSDLQAVPHPTLAYYGADDTFLGLAVQQAQMLPCHLEIVPGDHFMAFALADNILPTAIAHIDAAVGHAPAEPAQTAPNS